MSADLDRRNFLRRASMGAAAAGALAVTGVGVLGASGVANAAPESKQLDSTEHQEILDGSDVLAQVINARTGEISILVGTREISYVNRDLAQQLIRAAR